MKPPKKISAFPKSILSGAFTGFIAAIINLLYNIIFRTSTHYDGTGAIGFLTITFGTMLICLIAGILFFFIGKQSDPNHLLFKFLFLALTVAGIVVTLLSHAPGISPFYGAQGLMEGFILLSGLLSAFMIPYLYHHPRIYI